MDPSYNSSHSDKFDHGVMDKFLNLSELPVIGSSALEQILHQASLDYPAPSSSPSTMSPDSSQWTHSTSGVESGSESSDIDCLPGKNRLTYNHNKIKSLIDTIASYNGLMITFTYFHNQYIEMLSHSKR